MVDDRRKSDGWVWVCAAAPPRILHHAVDGISLRRITRTSGSCQCGRSSCNHIVKSQPQPSYTVVPEIYDHSRLQQGWGSTSLQQGHLLWILAKFAVAPSKVLYHLARKQVVHKTLLGASWFVIIRCRMVTHLSWFHQKLWEFINLRWSTL